MELVGTIDMPRIPGPSFARRSLSLFSILVSCDYVLMDIFVIPKYCFSYVMILGLFKNQQGAERLGMGHQSP